MYTLYYFDKKFAKFTNLHSVMDCLTKYKFALCNLIVGSYVCRVPIKIIQLILKQSYWISSSKSHFINLFHVCKSNPKSHYHLFSHSLYSNYIAWIFELPKLLNIQALKKIQQVVPAIFIRSSRRMISCLIKVAIGKRILRAEIKKARTDVKHVYSKQEFIEQLIRNKSDRSMRFTRSEETICRVR